MYRVLGRTGLSVSEIGFGTVEIGMPYGIGIKEDNMISEDEAIRLLKISFERGLNFFDTARLYGNSEKIIGKAFKGLRKDVIISTKCTHLTTGHSKRELMNMIEHSLHESLQALNTDYVDVFMIHKADIDILRNDDIADCFDQIKKSGFARAIGVSTYIPEETELAIEKKIWDVIQLPFSLLDQRQKKMFALAKKNNIGIVVRSVLMKGLLSNRGTNLDPALKTVESHIANYNKLVLSNNCTLPEFATKFALSFDEISSVLIGIDRMEYLETSLNAANGKYLDQANLELACDLEFSDPDFLNLHTWNQMGWLK